EACCIATDVLFQFHFSMSALLPHSTSFASTGRRAIFQLSRRTFTAYHAVPRHGKSGNYVKTHIEDTVENNRWAVFSKTTCPFCSQAKQLLKDLNQKVAVVEIDRVPGGQTVSSSAAVFASMTLCSGYTAVPTGAQCDDWSKDG
ncbi:hypothetical protein FOZ63_032391, partial [Perkinsus olseni]